MLEKIMHDLFLKCLNINEIEGIEDQTERNQQLKHVLKSYALLGKQRLAEQLFTDYVVRPYLTKVSLS